MSDQNSEVNENNEAKESSDAEVLKEGGIPAKEPVKLVTIDSNKRHNYCLCHAEFKDAGLEKYLIIRILRNNNETVCSESLLLHKVTEEEKQKGVHYLITLFFLLDEVFKFIKIKHFKFKCQLFVDPASLDFLIKPRFTRKVLNLINSIKGNKKPQLMPKQSV